MACSRLESWAFSRGRSAPAVSPPFADNDVTLAASVWSEEKVALSTVASAKNSKHSNGNSPEMVLVLIAALQYQALCVVNMQRALALHLPGTGLHPRFMGISILWSAWCLNRAASSSAFTIIHNSSCEILVNPHPVELDITFGVLCPFTLG